MACEWSRHDPLVVWLVEGLVHSWVVQATMNPINAKVREQDEERKLDEVVQWEWSFGRAVI